jgi:hypothetical protein
MDALRWKSPRMPLAYNRNLAAEAGAVGRLSASWNDRVWDIVTIATPDNVQLGRNPPFTGR